MAMTIQSGVKGLILATQGEAFKDENLIAEGLNGKDQQMEKREDGSLHYMDRIWVPLVGGARTKIRDKAHKMRYFRDVVIDFGDVEYHLPLAEFSITIAIIRALLCPLWVVWKEEVTDIVGWR
ncbi:hypothetical protein Tco_1030872 [Tanacetum coccineum]|uniref:Uncharacterized protein n=1 Tax=Tanacetum coccineum TaxID=301880 RepID=A0ABQ5G7S2_9ASTR